MARLTVGTENGTPLEPHDEDHGRGRPVALVHGYPLDGRSRERRGRAPLAAGDRAVNDDRRGSGRSSQPTAGDDDDALAADLAAPLDRLGLAGVVLAGFSMGTGEVARPLPRHPRPRPRAQGGAARRHPALPAPDRRRPRGRRRAGVRGPQGGDRRGPLRLLQGLPRRLLQRRRARRRQDQRPGLAGELRRRRRLLALRDLRLRRRLADRLPLLPYDATAKRLPGLIADLRLVPVAGGPHNIGWTHPDEVNKALLEFLAE
jgi:non-heme chloroperoxidase